MRLAAERVGGVSRTTDSQLAPPGRGWVLPSLPRLSATACSRFHGALRSASRKIDTICSGLCLFLGILPASNCASKHSLCLAHFSGERSAVLFRILFTAYGEDKDLLRTVFTASRWFPCEPSFQKT